MRNVRLSRGSLFVGLLLGVLGTLGVERAMSEASAGKGKSGVLERQVFHDTLDLVLDRYVEPVDTSTLMSRGLKQMVAGLDSHSHYMTAQERELAQKRADQGAEAGLITTLRGGTSGAATLEVIAVHPGSPADKLGIAAGTRIVEIRGHRSSQLSSNAEAQIQLSGAAGERISLCIDRGAGIEKLELELRRPDSNALVSSELIEHAGHSVGTISIRAFRSGTGEGVKRALAQLRTRAGSNGLSGLILDVRGNPGGKVDEALIIADLFIDKGVLTRTRGRGGVILREELATSAGSDTQLPLIVLQDARSASASELLAVALQENGRATIMGEHSFGKGTVQELIGIADGSLLTLTVARYFSPNDRSIDGQGVEPDLVLEHSGPEAVEAACREIVERANPT